ncbi:MAG: ABC transporter permease [Candidatus Magnetoovum sp. WYHC-5]|nr:ABC transporter permease [Candidatus Magnetoovum sp. WYHC-5]
MFLRVDRFIGNVVKNRYMLKSLVVRDMKGRYAGSFMGIFWSVIHPLIMFLTYNYVFTLVFKARLGQQAGTDNFALWLLCGLLPWIFFSDSIMRSANVLITNKPLITKSIFPSELLTLGIIFSNLINHFIIFTIILIAMLIMDAVIHPYILLLPLYTFPLILMTTGIGWMVSGINVFFRDIEQVFAVLINFLFFYTPILYEPQMLSKELQPILKINPLFYVVNGYRHCILGSGGIEFVNLSIIYLLGGVLFIAGGMIFKRLKPEFAELL